MPNQNLNGLNPSVWVIWFHIIPFSKSPMQTEDFYRLKCTTVQFLNKNRTQMSPGLIHQNCFHLLFLGLTAEPTFWPRRKKEKKQRRNFRNTTGIKSLGKTWRQLFIRIKWKFRQLKRTDQHFLSTYMTIIYMIKICHHKTPLTNKTQC